MKDTMVLIAAALVVLGGCDSRSPAAESMAGPRYLPEIRSAPTYVYEDDEREEREAINQAKQEVIEAQRELSDAWRALDGSNWGHTLNTVADRLRDLEDANDQLGSLDPAAADDMDWEVRRMRSEMDRLYSENWRHVVPSLDVITQDIEYAGDDMEASLDDE